MRWAAACVAAALVLLLAAPPAVAERKYRVEIVTEPEGAEIRIDDPDSDSIGTSPWRGTLAAGPYMLIVDLDGHEQLIEEIVVKKKRRKRQRFSFTLQEVSKGTLAVRGQGTAAGAAISIDGEETGTVPESFEVSEGSHELVVAKDGFEPFEKWIEVSGGKTAEVTIVLERIGGDEVEKPEPIVKKPAPLRVAPLVKAFAGMQLAWRRWDYLNPRSGPARAYAADWIPVLRAALEAYPLATLDNPLAHEFGLRLGVGLGMPPAVEAAADNSIDTSWSDVELGSLYRYPLSDSIGLRADLAWGRTRYRFTKPGALVNDVPDVKYHNLRAGLRADYTRELRGRELRVEVGASYLNVLRAGAVAQRFARATASGMAIEAGLWYRISSKLRLGGAADYRRFVFEFEPGASDPIDADGSTDIYVGLTLGAAYSY